MLALARIDACFAAWTNVMVGPLHLIRVKEVAQIGAGIGREFTYRLLAAVAPISGTALQLALEQLTRTGLIFCHGEPPDATYIFKHALLQDAAYASMLRGRRQQLHSRIAHALEDQVVELAEAQPQLMAHHTAGHEDDRYGRGRRLGRNGRWGVGRGDHRHLTAY